MIQKGILILFFLLPITGHAFWGSDSKEKRDVCVTWYGEKEPCMGPKKKTESYFGFQMYSFIGNKTKSATGSSGYGGTYLATTQESHFRFLFGGSMYYAPTKTYLDDEDYSANMLAADLILGLSIKPFLRSTIRPILEIVALGGIKSMEMANPPTGTDDQTLGFSYGGKAGMGFEVGFSRFTALKALLEYQDVTVNELAGRKDFPLDGLGFTIGLVFTQ